MNVLVTGAAGYIGLELALALQRRGIEVSVLDKLPTPSCAQFKTAVVHDLVYGQTMDLVDRKFDVIFHLAAFCSVSESMKEPFRYYMNNVTGLLELFRIATAKRIVFASSCAVYGDNFIHGPANEKDETDPISVYGRTKLMGEQIVRDSGVPYVILRYFNVAGRGRYSNSAGSRYRIIPQLVEAAFNGSSVPVTRDSTIRSYIHVNDVVEATIRAGLADSALNKVINVGHHAMSIKGLAREVKKVFGVEPTFVYGNSSAGDPRCIWTQLDQMQELLYFEPKTTLREIIKSVKR